MEPFQFAQANANIGSVHSRIVDQIVLCVTDDEPAPKQLKIGDDKVVETSRGGRIKIPYQVTKIEDAGGNLNAVAVDLPPLASTGQVNFGTKESGEFEVRIQAATPPGTYTF